MCDLEWFSKIQSHMHACVCVRLDLQKPALMAQELKSNLQTNINDTLMHCLETSTAWLYMPTL